APQRLTSSKAFSSDFTFRFGYRIWCLRRNALSFWQILFRPNSQAAESVHLYNRKPMAFCTLEPMAFCTLELIAGPEHHSFQAKATVLMLPLLSCNVGACMRLALWRFASASMSGKLTFCLAATTGKVLPEADATIQSSLQEAFSCPVRDLVICLWLS
ncbi:hypothetical protein WJX82_007294, partial [Trebouxia sp. C0006]